MEEKVYQRKMETGSESVVENRQNGQNGQNGHSQSEDDQAVPAEEANVIADEDEEMPEVPQNAVSNENSNENSNANSNENSNDSSDPDVTVVQDSDDAEDSNNSNSNASN